MTNEELLEQYIRTEIAEKNKLLGHTSLKPRYAPSYEQALVQFNKTLDSSEMIMILDCVDGEFVNNGADTEIDQIIFTLHFIKKVKANDFEASEEAFSKAKTLIKQVISKLYRDKKNPNLIIKYLEKNNKNYEKIHGNMPDNVRGYMITLRLLINESNIYNSNEWL